MASTLSYHCENYIRAEDFAAMTQNHLVLGTESVPLFYGAEFCDVNTIGGFANWVQDWGYTKCPHCGRPMKYLAQIQWDTILDGAVGTLYSRCSSPNPCLFFPNLLSPEARSSHISA